MTTQNDNMPRVMESLYEELRIAKVRHPWGYNVDPSDPLTRSSYSSSSFPSTTTTTTFDTTNYFDQHHQTQVRNYQEKLAQAEKSLREIHGEYVKQKGLNDRFHGILRSKNLEDNDTLLRRVHLLEQEIIEKEDRIAELEYQIEDLHYKAKQKRFKDGGGPEPVGSMGYVEHGWWWMRADDD